ncbi:MAG: Grx4 family monothiol glutaredoxin [Rickettsia sp.]|nr:Grx4 family monothiol glutaredoxin [Rickettsia sp.]
MVSKEKIDKIKEMISKDEVVLFMKGTKYLPNCGFSSHVVNILNKLEINFQDYNVLSDESLRASIKNFSNWPTIPQLYFKGEFIGGCNIVDQMYHEGELGKLLKS